jgi:hypothetical protein
VPSCHRDYAARLIEVANLADAMNLDDEFMSLSAALDPYIDADPRDNPGMADDTRSVTFGFLQSNPETARAWATSEFPELLP